MPPAMFFWFVSNMPASASRLMTIGRPPASPRSGIEYRPPGSMSPITGVFRLITSKSSIESSTFASWAMAR